MIRERRRKALPGLSGCSANKCSREANQKLLHVYPTPQTKSCGSHYHDAIDRQCSASDTAKNNRATRGDTAASRLFPLFN
jgi:hypothetical protein